MRTTTKRLTVVNRNDEFENSKALELVIERYLLKMNKKGWRAFAIKTGNQYTLDNFGLYIAESLKSDEAEEFEVFISLSKLSEKNAKEIDAEIKLEKEKFNSFLKGFNEDWYFVDDINNDLDTEMMTSCEYDYYCNSVDKIERLRLDLKFFKFFKSGEVSRLSEEMILSHNF